MKSRSDLGMPLYPSEAALSAAILGPGREKEWGTLSAVWERSGLPRVDPQTGGRYWPAVRVWLDRRNGVDDKSIPAAQGGAERWDHDRAGRRARA